MIVRVDLGYVQGNTVDYESFNEHATRFLKRIHSNSIFDDLLGYIAKREYGFVLGYHVHLLLVYNSAKRVADAYLGQQIGKLWQRRTTLKETGVSYPVKPDEYFRLTKPYGKNLLSRGRIK